LQQQQQQQQDTNHHHAIYSSSPALLALESAAMERTTLPERRQEDATGFKWRGSKAKKLIVMGLKNGDIVDSMSAQKIFDKYNKDHQEHFQVVGFRLFSDRLKRLQKKEVEKESFGDRDAAALAHDRLIYPMREYNSGGEPIWRKTSTVRKLLEQDIADHKLSGKKIIPEDLWLSREEYQKNDLTTFRNHIYSSKKGAKFTKWCEEQRKKASQV
jgi:hypothetical protein